MNIEQKNPLLNLLKNKKILTLCLYLSINYSYSQIVSTFAGTGVAGGDNGSKENATFYRPSALTVDSTGNIYIVDYVGARVRKISTSGIVTTIAGSGTFGFADGVGTAASFDRPSDLAINNAGTELFIVDSHNDRIRKIDINSGTVSTFAGGGGFGSLDGQGINATFDRPYGIAIDNSGTLFVTEVSSCRIRKITPSGYVTTIAGSSQGFADGIGTSAKFNYPYRIATDTFGNLFVTDTNNNRIRKIIISSGLVSTIAGNGTIGSIDGTGANSSFSMPYGICTDTFGNAFVVDRANNKIRMINPSGNVSTIAGTGLQGALDGLSNIATFDRPTGIMIDATGSILIADFFNDKIRKISAINLGLEKEKSQNLIVLFPNPFNTFVTIESKDNSIENYEYNIVDLIGRIVQNGYSHFGEKINLENLTSGNYTLQISTEKGKTAISKIIKN